MLKPLGGEGAPFKAVGEWLVPLVNVVGVNELVLGAPCVVGGGGMVGGVSLDGVFTSTGESGIVECFSVRSGILVESSVHTESDSLLKSSAIGAHASCSGMSAGRERRAVRRGWGGIARGRVLGACACQAETDGELTLRIALGAEMWMMTGAHAALNPALSPQAEQ